ncbi:MAG TPA: hypothetical protein VGJ61_04285 [Solirubrobacterales bacterium]
MTWGEGRGAQRILLAIGLFAALVAAAFAAHSSASAKHGLARAEAVQEQNTDRLLARGKVAGTAVSEDGSGQAVIVVFTTRRGISVPNSLGGVPVDVEVTGPISSMQASPKRGPSGIDPTARFTRPVPIGVSTGNAGECSAGTISARVKSGGNVYALSNNHVYALENSAQLGSQVMQPGLYDTGCAYSSDNVIGTLAKFVRIDFSDSANNVVDGAIASTTTANLGNSTPSNGYGTPSSTTRAAAIGLAVQKYGRTSSLTQGQVTDVNAILKIGYSSGTARFVNQVVVQSKKPFIKAGDSGSLLVSNDSSRNPVGLLFAGDSSGKYAIANPIGAVLSQLGVTIDGS